MTVCSVQVNPQEDLEYANSLHKNLQFTLEIPEGNQNLAFPDLNKNATDDRKFSSHWYHKSTDTGTILNFHSRAPLQLET